MAACHYCGEPKAKTEDHIVPKALGGTDAYINRVAACRRCNEAKAADMPTCSCGTCRYAVMYWEARQEGLTEGGRLRMSGTRIRTLDPGGHELGVMPIDDEREGWLEHFEMVRYFERRIDPHNKVVVERCNAWGENWTEVAWSIN